MGKLGSIVATPSIKYLKFLKNTAITNAQPKTKSQVILQTKINDNTGKHPTLDINKLKLKS